MKRFAYLVLGCSLAIAGACGDDGDDNETPDAGMEDPDPTVSPGTCGLVVGVDAAGFHGAPLDDRSGVPVVFNGPDGALLGVDFTDVKGEASFAQCVENTTISFVIEVDSTNRHIFSYAGAMPGDTFYYRQPFEAGIDSPTYVQVNVTQAMDLTPVALPGGGTYYLDTDIGCDTDEWNFAHDETVPQAYFPSNYLSDTEGISWSCLGENPDDIDVISWLDGDPSGPGPHPFSDGNDSLDWYSTAVDATVSMGNAVDGPVLNPVSMGPWMGPHTRNTQVVLNGPPRSESVNVRTRHYVDGQEFTSNGDDDDFNDGTDERLPPVWADDFRGLPEDFGESTVSYASILVNDASRFRQRLQNEVFGPFAADSIHDFADHLPLIRDVVVTDVLSGRPVLRWYADGAADAEMGAFRAYFWSALAGESVTWHLLTNRPEAGSFAVPELPANIAALLAYPDQEGMANLGSYNDFDWASFSGLLGTMGFDPNLLTQERSNDFVRNIPGKDMSMGGRMRRSQWSGNNQ